MTGSPFETLRLRAEADVAARFDPDKPVSRRPTWAPPLVLSGELLDICVTLKLLAPEDKPIARLWAQFADPKRVGRTLRQVNDDRLNAMPDVACRGFELHAGTARGKTHEVLFHAQRSGDGAWQTGPEWSRPGPSRWRFDSTDTVRLRQAVVLEQKILDGFSPAYRAAYPPETHGGALPECEQKLRDYQRALAEVQAADEQKYQAAVERHKLHRRAPALAAARVAEFVGGDMDAQMWLGGRLSGMCCICGRTLTDGKSLEIGVGPECIQTVRCRTPKGEFVRMVDAVADGRLVAVGGELQWASGRENTAAETEPAG
jgi:hypothetical protein